MKRKHPLAECEKCPLYKRDAAPTIGPVDAKIAFVSRSPGRHDAERKRPFGGPSGFVLDHLFNLYGVNRDDVLTTNLVLCETDNPPREAIHACNPRLQAEIANCDTVIAGGSEASLWLAKKSVTKGRGIVHERWSAPNGGFPKQQRVIVTNNPAAVLRESDNFPYMVEDFKLALDPPPPLHFPNVVICDNRTAARAAFKALEEYPLIASDLEGHAPHIECAGFSGQDITAYVLTRKAIESVWDEMAVLYERKDKLWLWHNGVYDVKLLRTNGINARISEDTFALSYCLDERPGTHSLAYLVRLHLGWPNYEPESVEKYKETGILPEAISELWDYNGKDTGGTLQLFQQLAPKAVADGQFDVYTQQLLPLFNALTDIERRGMIYNVNRAANLNEEIVLPKLRDLRSELAGLAGLDQYNPMSTPQTKAIVYDRWQLKHFLRDSGKKKRSTSFDKDVRREVREGRFRSHPKYKEKLVEFATVTDTFRSIETQRGTFIEGLISRVGEDGRLYCTFNPCGTVTGRTSSRDPNFQNITRGGRDVVPGIRTLFLPSPGNVIVSADYSQAELRCIAKLSGAKQLLAIYRDSKRSLHKETCLKFYGENYKPDEYVKAKNINFGVCYLQGAKSFAQMYVMPVKEAQDYIDNWFRMFPEVVTWQDSVKEIIDNEAVVVAPTGAKRRFHLITADNEEECYREGINFIPQNTAARLTTVAVAVLNNEHQIPIVNTVHDSIVADVPEDEAKDVAKVMKEVMERMPIEMLGWDDIPFIADISIGTSWGEVEEIEL